jgi:hypothetical protein
VTAREDAIGSRETEPGELHEKVPAQSQQLAPEDFYCENGLIVFTAAYHLKRGYCCNSGCRHCPFG